MNSEKQSTNLQMTLREVNRVGEVKKNIPKLRFKGYEDAWEQRKAKQLFVSKADKGYPDLPVLSATQDKGMVRRDGNGINIHYDEKNKSGYKRVIPGQFVIHLRSFQGGFAYSEVEGITSPAYTVFDFQELDKHIPEFWKYVFSAKDFIRRLEKVTYGIRDGRSIGFEDFLTLKFKVPDKREQKVIAEILAIVNNLITLHQRKYDALKSMKKTMLSKMFPKNGEDVPEIRFKGFTDAWEQRKLGEVSQIVGGGTPSTGIPEYWDGDIDWYSPVEIGEEIFVSCSQRKITQLGLEKSSAKILPVGTVLFTSRAGIGNTAILEKEGCTNQGFQSIVPKDNELDSYFIFSCSHLLKKYGETKGAGSTFVEISGKQMSLMPLNIPEIKEQKSVGNFFRKLDSIITLHQRKLDELKNMKKTLLQQMFV